MTIAIDDVVHLADVQTILDTVNVRERRINLDDDDFRPRRDGAVPEICGAEVKVPLLVNGTGLHDHEVHGLDEAPVVIRDFAEVARDVILKTAVALLAVVAAEMPVVKGGVSPIRIGLEHRPRPHAQTPAYVHVMEIADSGG